MGEVAAGTGLRACSHAACRWPAIATLYFDYGSRRSWIEDLRSHPDPASYDLCSVHAGRFRPPMGWETEDRRRVGGDAGAGVAAVAGSPPLGGVPPGAGPEADGAAGGDRARIRPRARART